MTQDKLSYRNKLRKKNCKSCEHYFGKGIPCRKQPVGIVNPDTEFCTEYDSGCCGTCCWFKHEDTDGWGMCYKSETYEPVYCGAKPCADGDYVPNQAMRHYLAVLLWHNRWRRGNGDRMQDPKEVGKAIDFAVDYCKTFMKL